MPMSRKIAEELLPRLRLRYMGRGHEGRSLLIDELSEQWGYSRKHAINLLGCQNRCHSGHTNCLKCLRKGAIRDTQFV